MQSMFNDTRNANDAHASRDCVTLNDCERHIMLNANESSPATNDQLNVDASAIVAPVANVERTMSTNVVKRDANAMRYEKLQRELKTLQSQKIVTIENRNRQKRIRNELRNDFNHFGGTRQRSSRYTLIDAKGNAKFDRVALRERAKRRAKRDALRDIANDDATTNE